MVYYVFDFLHLHGRDRIPPKSATGRVRYTDHVVSDGERLFRELEKRKLEGIVAN
jgi:ATP-dependent DNA ligase